MCMHGFLLLLQSGCLWWPWCLAVSWSWCWSGSAGVSAVLIPAAAMLAVGAALTRAAAPDTVSTVRTVLPEQPSRSYSDIL